MRAGSRHLGRRRRTDRPGERGEGEAGPSHGRGDGGCGRSREGGREGQHARGYPVCVPQASLSRPPCLCPLISSQEGSSTLGRPSPLVPLD